MTFDTIETLGALAARAAAVLGLSRPLVGLDLETTGPVVGLDRIVEIGAVKIQTNGNFVSHQSFINPGWPIPRSAIDAHGITDDMVRGALSWRAVARGYHAALDGCDLTGYNVRFDVRILEAESARVGAPWTFRGRILDAYVLRAKLRPRTLTTAVAELGAEHTGAHRAVADVGAALFALLGYADEAARTIGGPATFDALHALTDDRTPDPDAVDDDGKFVRRGDDVYVAFGKAVGVRLAEVDPGYLRWMLGADFSPSTKRVCAAEMDRRSGRAPVARPEGLPL